MPLNKTKHNHSGENNPMWGRSQSEKCKTINRKRMMGNQINVGRKSPHLTKLNKSRAGIPISDISKEKQRKQILKYWKSSDGLKQRKALSVINKQWAKDHPNEKMNAAKNGHKACPRISSLERKVEDILRKLDINFTPQYEYELGFLDFLINSNIAVFVNGEYWHNYPDGTEKDRRQLAFLKDHGYETLVIWERELKNPDKVISRIRDFVDHTEATMYAVK